MDTQAAQTAYDDAQRTANAIRRERDQLISEATARIRVQYREEYRQRIHDAALLEVETRQALDRAKIEEGASHPLLGKNVMWKHSKAVSRFSSRSVEVITFGVVELMTTETILPGNISNWDKPQMGKPFVRLLKNSGAVGLKIDVNIGRYVEVPGA